MRMLRSSQWLIVEDNTLPSSQCQNNNCTQPDIYTNNNIAKMLKNMFKNRLLSKEFSYQFSNGGAKTYKKNVC